MKFISGGSILATRTQGRGDAQSRGRGCQGLKANYQVGAIMVLESGLESSLLYKWHF